MQIHPMWDMKASIVHNFQMYCDFKEARNNGV